MLCEILLQRRLRGDVNGSYELGCELQRKRVECAIMIKAALADKESSLGSDD